MMRYVIALLIAATAIAAAPTAFAQDNETPPDAESHAYGAEDCIECSGPAPDGDETSPETRGPEDCEYCRGGDEPTYDGNCGGEVCAYDEGPGALGPEDCIDCMQPPAQDSEEDYVQTPEGSEGGITSVEDKAADEPKTVPAAATALALVGGAIGVALLAGRRHR